MCCFRDYQQVAICIVAKFRSNVSSCGNRINPSRSFLISAIHIVLSSLSCYVYFHIRIISFIVSFDCCDMSGSYYFAVHGLVVLNLFLHCSFRYGLFTFPTSHLAPLMLIFSLLHSTYREAAENKAYLGKWGGGGGGNATGCVLNPPLGMAVRKSQVISAAYERKKSVATVICSNALNVI